MKHQPRNNDDPLENNSEALNEFYKNSSGCVTKVQGTLKDKITPFIKDIETKYDVDKTQELTDEDFEESENKLIAYGESAFKIIDGLKTLK